MRDIARRYKQAHTAHDSLNSSFIITIFLLVWLCLIDLKIANDDYDDDVHSRAQKNQPIRYVVRLLLN